jgi:hypothetical protein
MRSSTAAFASLDTRRRLPRMAQSSTGTLIVLFGLFARRSRTAAWTTPAIAIAGGAVALYFLEVFVRAAAQSGWLF